MSPCSTIDVMAVVASQNVSRRRFVWTFVLEVTLESEAHAGPKERFVRLADQELHRSYRLAGLILGNEHDAEDATQDALLRAWNAYSTLRRPTDFQAWFDRILVNVCRDRLRRRRTIRFLPMGDTEHQRPGADPFQHLIASDELMRAMDEMDADLRTCVVLRYWADLTVDEIARRTGWRSGTVKSRLHRALGFMRSRLAAPKGVAIR
jgi:RNA polymerase sigma-70 factor (ECF subfamily)